MAPGHDKITVNIMQKMRRKSQEKYLKMFNKIWKKLQVAAIISEHKKRFRKDCNNYRVTIIFSPMIILKQIIKRRIKSILEKTSVKVQRRFRNGRSETIYSKLCLTNINKTHKEKNVDLLLLVEYNDKIYGKQWKIE